jgi:hypothetical protein
MTKIIKPKDTKKPITKQVSGKPKMPKRPMPSRSGTAGRKGALGATSGY